MNANSKGRRSCAVLLALVIVVALIGIVLPLTASASFDSPFVKYDNIVITYSTADFAPSAHFITALDAVVVLSNVSGVDPFVLLQGYSFYKCSQGNYICAEMKSSTPFGYVFWRDSNGDYQYFIWKEGEEEETSSPVPDDVKDNDYQPATVTGKELKDFCNTYNSTYCPKNTKDFISWRNRTFDEATSGAYTLLYRNTFFCGDTWNEVYLLPFYTDGTQIYYSTFQFHFYKDIIKNEDGTYTATLYCDYWNLLDDTEPETFTIMEDIAAYDYIEISPFMSGLVLQYYDSSTRYVTRQKSTFTNQTLYNITINGVKAETYFSPDLGDSVKTYSGGITNIFTTTEEGHDASCTCNGGHDIGFYCSNKPIEKDFSSIDFTKLSDEDTVTLTGGTVYDYTITNNEGDSTTINNYITNNYTYPVTDTGDSGEEESGTGTGGNGVNENVTVGGQVDVNGDIDVGGTFDINLNIQTESGSGAGADQEASTDFLVPVDDYAEYLPEVAPEVTEYFETTYSFLPPEIIGLLIGGIGAAILCRILGR